MKAEKIFKNLPALRTKRLLLRKIGMGDVDDIFDYARRKEVSRYTIWDYHRNKKQTEKFVKFVMDKSRAGFPASWAIVRLKDGKLIGTGGFEDYSAAHNMASIGYALSPDCWNLGFMTEAVKKIIAFGFEKLRLNRIEAVCDVKNIGSARVMEKSGMKFEGILRHRVVSARGRVHDVKIYAIVKGDKPKAKRQK